MRLILRHTFNTLIERVMVTRTEFHFRWVYTFFVQLSYLRNWCTLTREASCDPAPPAQLCGSSCKHPHSTALLVIFSHGPFINFDVSLMLVCLGTPDLITVLFFSVSWQTIYYENANAISFVSPINLLLLRTPQTNFKPPSMLLIWRWICFYPGQQTQVRNSL